MPLCSLTLPLLLRLVAIIFIITGLIVAVSNLPTPLNYGRSEISDEYFQENHNFYAGFSILLDENFLLWDLGG